MLGPERRREQAVQDRHLLGGGAVGLHQLGQLGVLEPAE
jgi:hypothetical protein